MAPDDTGLEQSDTKFKPGQSGNPAGRPKGARSKLGEAFLSELLKDFEEHGAKAIIKVREDKPADYVKVVASILPKELSGPDGEPLGIGDPDATRRALESVDRALAAISGRSENKESGALPG